MVKREVYLQSATGAMEVWIINYEDGLSVPGDLFGGGNIGFKYYMMMEIDCCL